MGYSPGFETNATCFGTAWVWEKYARKHLPIYIYPVLKITLRILATIEIVHHWPRDEMPYHNLLEIGFNPHNLDLTSKKNYKSMFLFSSEFLPLVSPAFLCLSPVASCVGASFPRRQRVCWAVAGCSLNLRWPQFSPSSSVRGRWENQAWAASFFLYGFVWKCWVYSQWNSHLIGIMISKTIGFRGTQHFQTNLYSNPPKNAEVGIYSH